MTALPKNYTPMVEAAAEGTVVDLEYVIQSILRGLVKVGLYTLPSGQELPITPKDGESIKQQFMAIMNDLQPPSGNQLRLLPAYNPAGLLYNAIQDEEEENTKEGLSGTLSESEGAATVAHSPPQEAVAAVQNKPPRKGSKQKQPADKAAKGASVPTAAAVPSAAATKPSAKPAASKKAVPAKPVAKPVAKKKAVPAKPAAKKAAAKPVAKKKGVPEKPAIQQRGRGAPGVERGKYPGVLRAVMEIIVRKGPIPKNMIAGELHKLFPDRTLKALQATVYSHVPGRLKEERGFAMVVAPNPETGKTNPLLSAEALPERYRGRPSLLVPSALPAEPQPAAKKAAAKPVAKKKAVPAKPVAKKAASKKAVPAKPVAKKAASKKAVPAKPVASKKVLPNTAGKAGEKGKKKAV